VPFEYALLRVVPRIERGEAINAGVLLYCRALDHLGAAVSLDPARLAALDPTADAAVTRSLDALAALCGDSATEAARHAGRAGEEDRGRRFRRLTPAARSCRPARCTPASPPTPPADLTRLPHLLVRPPTP